MAPLGLRQLLVNMALWYHGSTPWQACAAVIPFAPTADARKRQHNNVTRLNWYGHSSRSTIWFDSAQFVTHRLFQFQPFEGHCRFRSYTGLRSAARVLIRTSVTTAGASSFKPPFRLKIKQLAHSDSMIGGERQHGMGPLQR
jgi:hypothetical protein